VRDYADQRNLAAGEDTALTAFVLLLSFLDRPADPQQLRHLLGRGSDRLTADDLVRLGKKLDVRARKVRCRCPQSRS
jgi:subfamily B ATP-binding cassette protein HlyB/CyaB